MTVRADPRGRFAEMYDAYSGLILAYASARTDDPADAADIVADVFTVAWRRIHEVPEGVEARPWLYGVARKSLANHRRGRRRRQSLNDRIAAQVVQVIEPAAVEDGPEAAAIVASLGRLREPDRELLLLVGWEQLSRDEIASVLRVSRRTVRMRLHRARSRFETALADHGVKRIDTTEQGPGRWATALPGPEEA